MNVFLLLAAVFGLFIIIDILSAKLLKVKRNWLRNISLAVLGILTVLSVSFGFITLAKNSDTETKVLYTGYRFLLEGNAEKARESAAKAADPHADMIILLADFLDEDYASTFINSDDLINSGKLNDDLHMQADKIYSLSRQMNGLEGLVPDPAEAAEQITEIINDCFSLLKVSEKSEVEFMAGFERDRMLASEDFLSVDSQTLSEMLLETPNDTELLRYSVQYYNAVGGLDEAEEYARKLMSQKKSVENIVLYTDVIAQKLISEVAINDYDENDKEVAALIRSAAAAEEAALSYEEDNPRYMENLDKAAELRKQANGVKAKRIINWLIAQAPLFGDNSGVIDLQLSKLYAASGNEAKAREILVSLIKREEKISDSSPIKGALAEFKKVYYDNDASDSDIAEAITTILQSKVFLKDSVLNRGYSQFLNNLLKYERVSIFISRINADNYPVVRAYLNVNGKKDGAEELANDFGTGDFTFADNGFSISPDQVRRVEDDPNNYISIALVIDGSGSMQGDRIRNAQKAVESCIKNIRPETQELAIVLYSDTGTILTPLTNDAAKLQQGAAQIKEDGGTNISSGIYTGIETLEQAEGTKAIILMTDGEDNAAGEMEDAIIAAQEADVAVFTVSTGGGNREYMENIAQQTGGTYMEAVTDEELVNVYTALQNYIVNNYCFEYTVTEETESNPRILSIGLKDYEVSSSRTYGYDGMMIARDGSYITRGDSGSLRLLYAEPAVVSVEDARLGVPVFIHTEGAVSGTTVLINGEEISNVKVTDNAVLAFMLSGQYQQGALNITVRLPDGTSRNTNQLLTIADNSTKKAASQTIFLGQAGHTLYADHVEQRDDYTLKLSGNIILNGFLHTDSVVTLHSSAPITTGGNRLTVREGSINGNGAVYADFTSADADQAGYAQLAFGDQSVKVLDLFSFNFNEKSISSNIAGTSLLLPGFGTVKGDVQFDGSEIIITASGQLNELQDNLNYALNGVPLTQVQSSFVVQAITGYVPQGQNDGNRRNGLLARAEELAISIRKNQFEIVGNGTVSGFLGSFEIADGKLTVDTTDVESMMSISGTARMNRLPDYLGIDEQAPLTISFAGYYPDRLKIAAAALSIDGTELSECFEEDNQPVPLDGEITVSYPLNLENEPYRGPVAELISDVSLNSDKIEFISAGNERDYGIKVYQSSEPDQYVIIRSNSIEIPIRDIDELQLFGADLGGEISGRAIVSERQIELHLEVDGHLDHSYYNIKHDGKAEITTVLPRNASPDQTITITLNYGGEVLEYDATATGNIILQDGFQAKAEGNES